MGKKCHDLSKFARQELLLTLLEIYGRGDGISTSGLLILIEPKVPGLSRRTLYRDLNELSVRYPIYQDEKDGVNFWLIDEDRLKQFDSNQFRDYYRQEILKLIVA